MSPRPLAAALAPLLLSAALAACDRPRPQPETPRLEVSSAQVSFTAPDGGYDPAASDVVVTSVGGPLAVTGVSAVYAQGSGWLSFDVRDATASPATVTIRPHVAGLASGTYRATAFVAATGVVNSPFPVEVRLTVPPPRIAVSADEVRFVASDDGPAPSYALRVSNAGGGSLAKPTAAASVEWLSVTVTGSSEPYSVVVRPLVAGAGGLGVHSATLTIASPGVADPALVSVQLHVPAWRELRLSRQLVRFQAESGGAIPAPRTIDVTAVASSGLTISPPTVTKTPNAGADDWLDVAVTGSGPSYLLTLTPNALTPLMGNGAQVYVSLTSEGVSASLMVQLNVWSPLVAPLLEPSAMSLRFSALAGGPDPAPQAVTVSDADGFVTELGALDLTWWTQYQTPDWFEATALPGAVSVQPRVAGLPPGGYYGTIAIRSEAGGFYWFDVSMYLVDWGGAGSLLSGAVEHTATALPDGKALVAGGHYWGEAGIEVYDPAEASLQGVRSARGRGHLSEGRAGHTATALPDGRVVAAGGFDPWTDAAVGTWELYEPASGAWRVLRPLVTPRFGHTATLLADGTVLVAGGATGTRDVPGVVAGAEIIDPATGASTPAGAMSTPRRGASAVRLANGKVLVAGGWAQDGTPLASAELFDPALGTWSPTGALHAARADAALVLLDDGRVLAAGGSDGSAALSSAELYAGGGWSPTGSLATGRVAPAVRLPDGDVLLVSGATGDLTVNSETVERFDPVTGVWSPAGALAFGRTGHAVTLLSTGFVLVTGGRGWPFAGAETEVLMGKGFSP